MTLRIPLERSRSFTRNIQKNVHTLYGNIILTQACIGYDVPRTLILTGIFAGALLWSVVSSYSNLLPWRQRFMKDEGRICIPQLIGITTCFGVACVIPWSLFVKQSCYVQSIYFDM